MNQDKQPGWDMWLFREGVWSAERQLANGEKYVALIRHVDQDFDGYVWELMFQATKIAEGESTSVETAQGACLDAQMMARKLRAQMPKQR